MFPSLLVLSSQLMEEMAYIYSVHLQLVLYYNTHPVSLFCLDTPLIRVVLVRGDTISTYASIIKTYTWCLLYSNMKMN